jgi:anti-anti-sigma regulatory factor
MTFKIERSLQDGCCVLTLSGRIQAEQVSELKQMFELEKDNPRVVLDLQEVRLADREAVRFLGNCEAAGMKLENCPAYIREWIDREKG